MSIQPPATLEALLQEMVRHETVNMTVSGNQYAEAKLTAYLESLAKAWGLNTRRLPVPDRGDNLLVYPELIPGAEGLVFMSHIDTVSIAGMTIDPLAAKIEGGRMWGRGACDTKGTGSSMLWSLRRLAQEKNRKQNVALVFTLDEEYGMLGVRNFIKNGWNSLGFKARGVIIGEPTSLKPVIAHPGMARWKIITRGVSAHSSNPANGYSAISDALKVVQRMESVYIPSLTATHPLTGKAQASVNIIKGGVQVNIIPEYCEVWMDRRVAPTEKMSDVLPAVERELDVLRKENPKMKVELEPLFLCPPQYPELSRKLLPEVQAALQRCELPSQEVGAPYGTEAGDLSDVGIPSLVIGPGDVAQAHTKDEWLDLKQLHAGAEMYYQIMVGS